MKTDPLTKEPILDPANVPIARRKDDYRAVEKNGEWFVRNETQGRTLLGCYSNFEAAERTIMRIKYPLGPDPRMVLGALVRKGRCTPNELALSDFPDTFSAQFCKSEFVNKALYRLRRFALVDHVRDQEANAFEDVWFATKKGMSYAAIIKEATNA